MGRFKNPTPPKQHRINRALVSRCYGAMNIAIQTSNTRGIDDNELTKLTLPIWQNLEKLRVGELDGMGFVALNEYNCMAWAMAKKLVENGTTVNTMKVAQSVKTQTETAAEALKDLGLRFNESKRFTARASELSAIREAIRLCDELLGVMPRGLALQAMREAAEMVNGAIDSAELSSRAAAA